MHAIVLSGDRSDDVMDHVANRISEHFGRPPDRMDFDRADAVLRTARPDLLIIDVRDIRSEFSFDFVRHLCGLCGAPAFMIGSATDARGLRWAMRIGAAAWIDEQNLDEELDAALVRLQPLATEPRGTGDLLAVLPSAGGCGASTLAVNLAAILAREHGSCNLVDLNPGKADLAPLLDLKPRYTLADLCQHGDRLDASLYEKLLDRHPSGIGLLSAPRDFDQAKALSAATIGQAVELARAAFPHVLVDLEDCFHEEQALVLDQATRILLICRMDFTSIRNARRIADHLAARGIPRERIEVVANQHGLPNELPVSEAERAIGGPIRWFIPHDPETIGAANNMGIPCAISASAAPVVRKLAALVGLEHRYEQTPSRFAQWWAGVWPRLRGAFGQKVNDAKQQERMAAETRVDHEQIHAYAPHPAARKPGSIPV